MAASGLLTEAGMLGAKYNRTNYKFDQNLRWKRFVSGRDFAVQQFGMFREDVSDLTNVTVQKLKIFAPLMVMGLNFAVVILVFGRSGVDMPGPPVWMSGFYLQCTAISFAFNVLGTWLAFHSAMRAQIAASQLRTRKVRLPVPTQRQLDSARMLLSTFEEQSVYDMFRLPYVMPQGGSSQDQLHQEETKGKGKVKVVNKETLAPGFRMPGFTKGNPGWLDKEVAAAEQFPHASASGFGKDGATEPFEHFELIREAQKDWWCAEAYMRICFLFGFLHLIQALAYWLVLHCIAELLMIWCGIFCAVAMVATIVIMFRLDVLPEAGGCFPIEATGPIFAAVTLALVYTADVRQTVIDFARGLAVFIVSLQILWTFRLYSVSKPSGGSPDHKALEAGSHLANHSSACDKPAWLPNAFQHVSYMIAPPKTKEQLALEKQDRNGEAIKDDAMINVDPAPWHYVQILLFVTVVGWAVQLGGQIVELSTGERALTTIPGSPPWTRSGQWFGWEHGSHSSKSYAHLTPQHGHFMFDEGWGPNGQQELWTSDKFGHHPEADAFWSEPDGPNPRTGRSGEGKNTWAALRLKYKEQPPLSPLIETPVYNPHVAVLSGVTVPASASMNVTFAEAVAPSVDSVTSFMPLLGGIRRLEEMALPATVRPVVPAAAQWPPLFEPEILSCGYHGEILALSSSGLAALIKAGTKAEKFLFDGLTKHGKVLAATWGKSNLLVMMSSGAIASCPHAGQAGNFPCTVLEAPHLPHFRNGDAPAVTVFDFVDGEPMFAAVAGTNRISVLELSGTSTWTSTVELPLPQGMEVVALSTGPEHLLATTSQGAALRWSLKDGRQVEHEVPAGSATKSWRSACALPDGKVVRLASSWRKAGGSEVYQPELFL